MAKEQVDYSQYVAAAAKKYGVPEKLINQLIQVESSGNPNAQSKTGPKGLMQVSRAVAKEAGYSSDEMFDPEKNIDAGTKYLAQNLKAFDGNVSHALLGYNQGTGGARQMLSGKKAMATEGWNYIHNKKFSPEYLSKDAQKVVPSYGDYMTPDTNSLVEMGKEGVNPTPEPQYNTSAMFNQVPQEAAKQEPEETETERRLREGQKYLAIRDQLQNLFGPRVQQQQQQIIQAPQWQPQQTQQLDSALFSTQRQQVPNVATNFRQPALTNVIGM